MSATRQFHGDATPIAGDKFYSDEVANMIVYLCSPLASATTGAALRVEGGVVRAIL
jgi:enoyl-[acyl-carrier-protein] reductase (NADH)